MATTNTTAPVQLTGVPGAYPGNGTSDVYTTPFPIQPGTRARDRDGNEYVFCDFTATVYAGVLVQITAANLASPLLGTAGEAYRVGVVIAASATSDNAGWVQIYGLHDAVQTSFASDSSVTSGFGSGAGLTAQTSISTPSGTLGFVTETSVAGIHIHNMWINAERGTGGPGRTTDSSGPSTNASPSSGNSYHTGLELAVFLNYPYVTGLTVEPGTS